MLTWAVLQAQQTTALDVTLVDNDILPGTDLIVFRVIGDLPANTTGVIDLYVDYNQNWYFEEEEKISAIPFTQQELERDRIFPFIVITPTFVTYPTTFHARARLQVLLNGQVIFEYPLRFYLKLEPKTTDIDLLTRIKRVVSRFFPGGSATSINSKIDTAMRSIQRENETAAINQLQAAINHLDAIKGNIIAQAPISGRLADALIDLIGMPIAEMQEECTCKWKYEITTKYLGLVVEEEQDKDNYLKMSGEGANVRGDGSLKVSWPQPKKRLGNSVGSITTIEVKLEEKCERCKPEIHLIGGINGRVLASFVEDALDIAEGAANSSGKGWAEGDLEYKDGKSVLSGDNDSGLSGQWLGLRPDPSLMEGTAIADLKDKGENTVPGDKATVTLHSRCECEMWGQPNAATGWANLLVNADIYHSELTITAKCKEEDGTECKGSLTIKLNRHRADVTQNGTEKKLKAPAQRKRGDTGKYILEWLDVKDP